MNKAQLLEILEKYRACWEGKSYVRNHKSDCAAVILETCDNHEYLLWLMAYLNRLDRFVGVCFVRVIKNTKDLGIKQYQYETLKEYFQMDYGLDRFYSVEDLCDRARRTIASASGAYDIQKSKKEEEAQLKGLQRIAAEWALGKPAEVRIDISKYGYKCP